MSPRTSKGFHEMKNGHTGEDYDNQPIGIDLADLLKLINESDPVLQHCVYLWKKEDMEKYKNEVFQILVGGNAKIGGPLGVDSADQLVAETDYWKLCQRKGRITAVICYSEKRGGRKTCHGGCLTTEEGERDMSRLIKDEMKRLGPKVWAEVTSRSGHP